jgi:aldehyde dehydrogenase (NAD+)
VIKAAGSTALSILVLGRLIKKPGFPPGVVNILNGYGKEVGAAMVQQELVCKVAFTGSSGTASQIMKTASASLGNIALETGGESHLPVFSDADLEQAVRWSHMAIMSNQGQICTATSRLLAHQG